MTVSVPFCPATHTRVRPSPLHATLNSLRAGVSVRRVERSESSASRYRSAPP